MDATWSTPCWPQLRAACLRGPLSPTVQSSLVRWDQRIRNHIGAGAAPHDVYLVAAPSRNGPAIGGDRFWRWPTAAYQHRVIESDVLLALRPDLAKIPVDGNSFSFHPPGRQAPIGRVGRLIGKVDRHLRAYYCHKIGGFDPRRYSRLFDIEHPRWRALRQATEPLRGSLYGMLNAQEVNRMLPAPMAADALQGPN